MRESFAKLGVCRHINFPRHLLATAAAVLAIPLVPGAVQAQTAATWVASSYPSDGSAPWLAPGQAAAGDISAGRNAGAGASAPMPEYQFEGRQGQVVTVRVTSPDVHTSVYIRRSSGVTPIGYSPFSTKDIDRSSEVTATIPKDGTYTIVIGAHQTNKNGGPVWSWRKRAQAGRYVITLAAGTSALPAPDASAASSLAAEGAQPAIGDTPPAKLAAASLATGPLTSYPQDGAIPTIQLGQEAAGYIQKSRKFRRMAVPVPVYKFTGRRGQRICARADSTDGNARVHIGRLSKDAVSAIWSGILPWDTLTRNTGSSILVTLPDDGDYYIYAELKPWSISLEPNKTPLSSGRYEIKLWDAERAEPASVSPIMATRPYAATDGDRLGNWEPLAERPHVGVYETLTSVTKNPDGSFIHRVTYLDGGLKEETHYFPTGQRGVYRSSGQRVAEIQCDGSVIVYLDQSRNRFELTKAGGGGVILVQTYALQRPAQVYAAEMSRIGFPSTFSQDTLWVDSPSGRRQAMQIADLLDYGRREEERGAREQAAAKRQRDQEMGQAFGNALGRVAGAYAEAAADNDRMRRTLDDATARGLAEGNAIRRQREAEEARRQGELAGDQADRRRAGAENAGLSREQAGSGPVSSANGQPGLTIADRREPVASPQAPTEPETRQIYAWCMALRPNQNVTYSTVQQVTVPNYGWSDSSMAQDFGAVAGGGVSVCSNTDSRAAAQAQLDSSKTQHRGIKQTTTSAILRP